MRRYPIVLAALLLSTPFNFAHYSMLLPDKPWAEKGEKITFTYQFGHPFEHELFDAPKPAGLAVISPKGKSQMMDVEKTMSPIQKDGADGKKVTAWQFAFTPPERGDYTFALRTAKLKHDENKVYEDVVMVVLHVQTQNGWEYAGAPWRDAPKLHPLTRPYGLLPGMVFSGEVPALDKSGARMVEIEKYNPRPMRNLPPDELITFKSKIADHGMFVTTLPSAGWWGLTAVWEEQRATLWVHVDEKK